MAQLLPEPMFLVSKAGVLLAANEAAYAMLGLDRSRSLEGESLQALVDDDPKAVALFLRRCSRNREMLVGSLQFRNHQQAPARCEGARYGDSDALIALRAVPRREAVSRFVALNQRIEALAQEIRRREGAEHALAESERQFRALVESIPNLCWMAEADGWIVWYNRRWYEYTGATPKQMEGWGWRAVHDPKVLPEVEARWRRSIATGTPFEMVFPLRGADGEYREFLTRVVPMYDAHGHLVRWFGTNTDVSQLQRIQADLQRSRERLRISEERLRLTHKAAKIGSWELDLETEHYVCSPEVYEILGIRDAQLTRQRLLGMMYFSSDRENSELTMRVAATKNKEFESQFRIRRPDGQARWIAARGKPFFNQGRNLVLGVFIDITETRRSLQQAEEQPARARKGRKPKSDGPKAS